MATPRAPRWAVPLALFVFGVGLEISGITYPAIGYALMIAAFLLAIGFYVATFLSERRVSIQLSEHVEEQYADETRINKVYDIYLRVENKGRADSFRAWVGSAGGADQVPATPWHVRWRESNDRYRELASGRCDVLYLGRWDPMGIGWREPNEDWKPGRFFAFLPEGRQLEMYISREGARSLSDMEQRYFAFTLCVGSERAVEPSCYEIRLGQRSQSDDSPRILIHPQR